MSGPVFDTIPAWLVELVERLGEVGLPAAARCLVDGRTVANSPDRDLFGRDGGPWPPGRQVPIEGEEDATGVVFVPCSLASGVHSNLLRIVIDAERAVAVVAESPPDGSKLDALAAVLSAELVDQLLVTFLRELAPRVEAIETGQPAESRRATDVLRTASLLIGANGLAGECDRIERGADPGPSLRVHAAAARALAESWRSSRLVV